MAKWTIFLLLSACVLASAQTPSRDTIQRTSASAKALVDLEQRWVDALQKADTATLDSILDDTYVDTDEMGHRSDKQELIAVLKSGELKMNSIKLSDMQVHEYGTAAVVTGRAVQGGNFKGQALTDAIVFTDTFVRKKGKWRAVASHRSTSHDAS
jgi:ketosteroid isomerase-like protein